MSLMKLFKGKSNGTAIVLNREGHNDGVAGDAYVRGSDVVLYNPPVLLDESGQALAGIDRQMVANYLVQSTGMLAEVDLGTVRVDWKKRVGRFASASLQMESWGQELTILVPVQVVSSQVEGVMKMYQEALCEKARQVHRGHQDYSKANVTLRRAARRWEQLRDESEPHASPAEFLFVGAHLAGAQVQNALLPLPGGTGDQVLGQTARVMPADGRLPSGG